MQFLDICMLLLFNPYWRPGGLPLKCTEKKRRVLLAQFPPNPPQPPTLHKDGGSFHTGWVS